MAELNAGNVLIIVPVTKMAGKLSNLRTWLSKITSKRIRVSIIHDFADSRTSLELKGIIDQYPEIDIVLIEEKLQSPGLARNIGLNEQNYEWVSFIDSDDFVDVTALINMIDEAPLGTEVVIGNYLISSAKGTQIIETSKAKNPKLNVALNPGVWRMVFRREVIGLTRFTKYKMGEDQLFLLDLNFFKRKLYFSEQLAYTYFRNIDGQLTSDRQSIKDISNVIKYTIIAFNNADDSTKNYVGMLLLKQIISETKYYFIKNPFIAICKLLSNLIAIKPTLILIVFRNFFIALSEQKNTKLKTTHVIFTGGLGNQLFQYAAALSRSSSKIIADGNLGKPRLNSQQLPAICDFELIPNIEFLPLNRFSKFISRCSNYLIRSGVNSVGIEKTKSYNYLLKVCSSIIFSFWFRTQLTVMKATDNGYFDMKKLNQNDLLIGYFQSYKWASEKKVKLQLSSLKLKNTSSELSAFIDQYNGKSILSVHVRLGDYKYQSEFGLIDKLYYEKSINSAESKIEFEYIWLFSDEPSEAVKLLPKRIIHKVVIVPDFQGSAAETLEAMRYCHAYIIANSSLSWWGAYLSYSTELPLVIAPEPWFRFAIEPNLITDPSWLRLPAWPSVRRE